MQIDGENSDVKYELGCLYLANKQYAEAQALAEQLWDNGNDNASAGVLLLLSLAGQGDQLGKMAELGTNAIVAAEISRLTADGNVYTVGNDIRELKGFNVAIYPEGFVYFGEFLNGMRSGKGVWFYPQFNAYYAGAWENDMPNGEGAVTHIGSHLIGGNYTNGMENGEMAIKNLQAASGCDAYHPFVSQMGIKVVEDNEGLYQYIENDEYVYGHVYAWCNHTGEVSTYVISREQLNVQWGVAPWAR